MSDDTTINDSAAPLIEHLTELRSRLIYSVAAFLVAMVFCFAFGGMLLDFLLEPIERTMRNLGNPNPVMQYTAPQEYFFTLIRISVVGGLTLSFPSSPISFGGSWPPVFTRTKRTPSCRSSLPHHCCLSWVHPLRTMWLCLWQWPSF